MNGGPAVMWFRRDLRLDDNPALLEAVAAGKGRVVGLFVVDPVLWDRSGVPRRDRLIASLRSLSESMGGKLVIRYGDPVEVVPALAAEIDAVGVHVAADFGPYGRRRDEAVAQRLGGRFVVTGSPYAVAPGRLSTGQGTPYRVFTPYFRAWLEHGWRRPADSVRSVEWVSGRSDAWPATSSVIEAGEAAARRGWGEFLERVAAYNDERDRPNLDSTSRMSIPLKYGEIHPRTMLADLAALRGAGVNAYRRQLAWRDFCAGLLVQHPDAAWRPLRPEFERMEYDEPGEQFDAWCNGRTGYPIVDAGMRQLARTGFMHNRVRMVVASFLVKDLHVHWKHGARWFMKNLLDGDLASNSLNWQWVAGCGADAAPYFRIFNPTTQGVTFDARGDYVRRWIPELAHLEGGTVHRPWAHVTTYPDPIVDHAESREEALRRYSRIR